MENIQIKTDDIQLDQLLKLASIVESGGQVKYMIADELIKLNGNIVTERRRKIQSDYNKKNNIIPKTINKKVTEILEISQKSSGNSKDSYSDLSKKEKEVLLRDLSKEMKLANQFDNILINNILEKAEEEVFNIVSSFLSQEN